VERFEALVVQIPAATSVGHKLDGIRVTHPDRRVELRDRFLAQGVAAQKSGQFRAAQEYAEQALAVDSDFVPAMFLNGIALARLGERHRAVEMLVKVLAVDPTAYEALMSLSTIYRELDRTDDAIQIGRRAVKVRPNDAMAHNSLGRSLLVARQLEEAAASFTQAAALQPGFAPAYHNLGKTRQLEGKDGEAAKAFGKAAMLAPTVDNLLAYGQMLLTLCDYDGTVEVARRCIAQYPDSSAAHILLCSALGQCNATEEAALLLQRAIELDPEGREALQIAALQRPLGLIEEANENLRRAIKRNPRQVSAYNSLVQNLKITEEDRALVDQMLRLVIERELGQTELVSLHYGLGKALEDLKDFEQSMHHYDEANRVSRLIKLGGVEFDREAYRRGVDRIIEQFTPPAERKESPETSDLPILILGMMRSGTSLTEQIISCHPDVCGVGEQLFWSKHWVRVLENSNGQSIDFDILARLGYEYVAEMAALGKNARRVTDKMPGNYMFAGSIQYALPNARIIHVRRNPADTCLSIWATPNHMPHEGGHHKGNIAFVYKQYMRLMEFWRTVIPSDRYMEIDYEELVTNPENSIRSMIAFCGLEWDEACLRPHENQRLVATPSAWQVRQPFYGTSVARWKKFEPWLGAFEELVALNHPRATD